MENNIVPKTNLKDMAPDDIHDLVVAVQDVTAVYEEANENLVQLANSCDKLKTVGERYNALTETVRKKIAEIQSRSLVGKVQ